MERPEELFDLRINLGEAAQMRGRKTVRRKSREVRALRVPDSVRLPRRNGDVERQRDVPGRETAANEHATAVHSGSHDNLRASDVDVLIVGVSHREELCDGGSREPHEDAGSGDDDARNRGSRYNRRGTYRERNVTVKCVVEEVAVLCESLCRTIRIRARCVLCKADEVRACVRSRALRAISKGRRSTTRVVDVVVVGGKPAEVRWDRKAVEQHTFTLSYVWLETNRPLDLEVERSGLRDGVEGVVGDAVVVVHV